MPNKRLRGAIAHYKSKVCVNLQRYKSTILDSSKLHFIAVVNRAKNPKIVNTSGVVKLQNAALIGVLLLIPACKDDGLTRLLNGDSAAATNDRQPYVPGNTATQEELNRLQNNYAPGQSTGAVHSVMGSPDSVSEGADYYLAPDRSSYTVVPYDANGRWTGEVHSEPAPQWQSSPYPGAQ